METLEEVAEKYVDDFEYGIAHPRRVCKNAFINGAKWQQERSYNEEEVILLLQKSITHQDDGETGSLVTAQGKIRTANFYSWFEKYKKKSL